MITNTEFQNAIKLAHSKIEKQALETKTFTLSVKKRFDGYSLLDVYCKSFPHVAYDYWKNKIESGNLVVDKKQVKPEHKVRAGQITSHTVPGKPEPEVNWKLELLFASESYWVINKPSPLPVHAGGRFLYNTLTNGLKQAFPNQSLHLINRLDANTTGIVLVALNKETANEFGKQFENREVTKTYLSLVEGIPPNSSFTSSETISKTKTAAGGRKLEDGINSFTEFELVQQYGDNSLIKVTPSTGRTNQIRLHLAGLGLPIVGDLGYKDPEYFETKPLTYSDDSLFLHAWKLKFYDSKAGKEVEMIAPPNKKWRPFL